MRVTVVWGKETLVVDVDASLPPLVFKTQLFSLTGVPPERQKIMGKCLKSALLKARRPSRRRSRPQPPASSPPSPRRPAGRR